MNVKKIKDSAVLPARASDGAAGYDLYSCGDYEISPGKSEYIHTGIAVEIPDGFFGAIFARSGLASKYGLRPANCVGVIDSDYRGEIIVCIRNDGEYTGCIESGSRIAQMVLIPCVCTDITEVSELSETRRGGGGFGSTGIR